MTDGKTSFLIFIDMKKLMFLFMIIVLLSSCEMERRIYVHRHPWERMYHVHKYQVPRPYRKYEAPSRVYRNRDF